MRPIRFWIAIPLALIALLILAVVVLAQPETTYELDWWTVDGGGGTSEGGIYSLSGTIGQPDAGSSSGSGYSLDGGFWVKGILEFIEHLIHLPLIIK